MATAIRRRAEPATFELIADVGLGWRPAVQRGPLRFRRLKCDKLACAVKISPREKTFSTISAHRRCVQLNRSCPLSAARSGLLTPRWQQARA